MGRSAALGANHERPVHRAHVGDLQQSLPLRVVEVAPMVISRVISSSRPSFVSQCATDHIKPAQHRREPMSLEPNALSLKRQTR